MELQQAITAFTALSQETRLGVLKTLVEYGCQGTAAGVLSNRLNVPHNTLSFHLSQLVDARLISVRKDGRSMIYAANVSEIEKLIGYLQENCCILEDRPDSDCCPTPALIKETDQ